MRAVRPVPNGEECLNPWSELVFKKEKHHVLGHVGCRKKESFYSKSIERSRETAELNKNHPGPLE